jgi:hypothetical protein
MQGLGEQYDGFEFYLKTVTFEPVKHSSWVKNTYNTEEEVSYKLDQDLYFYGTFDSPYRELRETIHENIADTVFLYRPFYYYQTTPQIVS